MIHRMIIVWLLSALPLSLICIYLQTGGIVSFFFGMVGTGLAVGRFYEWIEGDQP